MATQCFLRGSDQGSTNLRQGGTGGRPAHVLGTSRGASVINTGNIASSAGPTAGVEINAACWLSEPLAADVTISGTITFNVWGAESNMSCNAGPQFIIERIGPLGTVVSTVINSEQGVELPVTTRSARNWTGAPTSTDFQKGDRIRVRLLANDGGGTMASGHTYNFQWGAGSAAADGDSYVSFTETFSFVTLTTPAGSILYFTDVTGPAVGSDQEEEIWTSRGNGVVNTEWASDPIGPGDMSDTYRYTKTAGGTLIEWYTKQLSAFTLAGLVKANLRIDGGQTADSAALQIAVCDSDGTNAVVWAVAGPEMAVGNTLGSGQIDWIAEGACTFWLAGDDVSVTNGQRLRFRIYADDQEALQITNSGSNPRFFYDGTTGGASGDSFVQLDQTVTEFGGAAAEDPFPYVEGGYYPV